MPAETLPDSSVHDSHANRSGVWIQSLLIAGIFVTAFIGLRNVVALGTVIARNRKADERSLADLMRAYPEQFTASRIAAGAFPPKPLPPITEWALEHRTICIFAVIFVPVAALATFAIRDQSQVYGILLGLGLVSIFEAFLLYSALCLPFI